MARIEKTRLDFFPFDIDFFDDEKIVSIFSEFGSKGELVVVKLLCEVYRNGYFLEWKETVRIKLVQKMSGVSEGLLDQIVRRLVKWGFFDKTLFDTAKVLTSRGIQSRYFSSYSRRSKAGLPYLLITDAKTGIIAAETPSLNPSLLFEDGQSDDTIIAAKNEVIDVKTTKTPVIAAKTPDNVAESTQKKLNETKDSSHSSESKSEPAPTHQSNVIEDYGAFVMFFNETVAGTGIKKIKKINPERKRLLDARCKEYGKECIADVIRKAASSIFLNGGGSEKFVATFDWLIHPRNFLRTLEGNYDNREFKPTNNHINSYGTDSNNGYRTGEDIINGATGIIARMSTESKSHLSDIPVV